MRFAVLPAAGKSTRMGRPKLALPLGERTILEQVVAALRQAEVEHILVIVGPHVRGGGKNVSSRRFTRLHHRSHRFRRGAQNEGPVEGFR